MLWSEASVFSVAMTAHPKDIVLEDHKFVLEDIYTLYKEHCSPSWCKVGIPCAVGEIWADDKDSIFKITQVWPDLCLAQALNSLSEFVFLLDNDFKTLREYKERTLFERLLEDYES